MWPVATVLIVALVCGTVLRWQNRVHVVKVQDRKDLIEANEKRFTTIVEQLAATQKSVKKLAEFAAEIAKKANIKLGGEF